MLDFLLGAMQNHHPGVFPPLKRALRNQFPWQNVIVILQSRAHQLLNLTQIHVETARSNRVLAAQLKRRS
jgi:hypothetical protein